MSSVEISQYNLKIRDATPGSVWKMVPTRLGQNAVHSIFDVLRLVMPPEVTHITLHIAVEGMYESKRELPPGSSPLFPLSPGDVVQLSRRDHNNPTGAAAPATGPGPSAHEGQGRHATDKGAQPPEREQRGPTAEGRAKPKVKRSAARRKSRG